MLCYPLRQRKEGYPAHPQVSPFGWSVSKEAEEHSHLPRVQPHPKWHKTLSSQLPLTEFALLRRQFDDHLLLSKSALCVLAPTTKRLIKNFFQWILNCPWEESLVKYSFLHSPYIYELSFQTPRESHKPFAAWLLRQLLSTLLWLWLY